MYDTDEGQMMIDNIAVNTINPQWLRQYIGLVAQVRILLSEVEMFYLRKNHNNILKSALMLYSLVAFIFICSFSWFYSLAIAKSLDNF